MPLAALSCVGLEVATKSPAFVSSALDISRLPRLPNETLADIFIYCADDFRSEHSSRPTRAPPSWVNVSYVCCQWRNVALSCPTLWTYVFFTSLRWTEELLVRSKRSPLKIEVISLYKSDKWCLASLTKTMEHMERIQVLCLMIRKSWAVQILDKLSLAAPLLQDLELSIGEPLEKSFMLFNGDTPSLRKLTLTCYRLPWYSLQLRFLTTLYLKSIVMYDEELEDLLTALSRMQDLSRLHLIFSLPEATPSDSAGSSNLQKIKLSRLSLLVIADFLCSMTRFLSFVDFPPDTQVKLDCQFEHFSSLHDYTLLSSLLAERLCGSAGWPIPHPMIRSLVIRTHNTIPYLTFSELDHVHETLVRNFEFFEYEDTLWDRHIPLYIKVGQSCITIEHILCELLCNMPLDNVQSLHVIRPSPSFNFWMRILRHFRGLRHLKLSEGSMPELASLLAISPRAQNPTNDEDDDGEQNRGARNGDSDARAILVPALEELVLEEMSFAAEPPAHTTPAILTEVGWLSALQDALSTRTDPPVRLEVLEGDEELTDSDTCTDSPTPLEVLDGDQELTDSDTSTDSPDPLEVLDGDEEFTDSND